MKKFCFEDLPIVKMKPGVESFDYDAEEPFRDWEKDFEF